MQEWEGILQLELQKNFRLRVISGFRRDVDEICALQEECFFLGRLNP
jgi:hypothetical protein